MANLTLLLYISIVFPLCMLLLLVTGKSRRLVLFFIFGITACLLCGELNGILTQFFDSTKYFTVNISPITEELCKAFPVIVYAFMYKPGRQQLLECGVAVGIGFAVLENAFILANNAEFITIELAVARGIGAGMMHGLCQAAVAYGLSYITQYRKLSYTGTITFLFVAIVYHSIYNCLVQSAYYWVAYILTVGLVMVIAFQMYTRRKRYD
ncbi:MAG: PrsW family intramembrane metalloprotease [Lachnospiraceae bacterium]|nr:PrsW family intramembrane metalloprotease [Candidatus Minthocola equi]